MAYILAVNSSIVADSGGTCVCDSTPDDPICAANSEYLLCKNEVKRDLVTATAAISALATFFLGALANMLVSIGGVDDWLLTFCTGPSVSAAEWV